MIIYIAQKFTPSPVTLRKPAALPKCSTVRVPGRDPREDGVLGGARVGVRRLARV